MEGEKFIYLHHGYISIPDYNFGESSYLENILSWYDETYHKRHYDGLYYEKEKRELRIPLGFGANSAARLTGRYVKPVFQEDEPRKVSIKLTVRPRDDVQEGIIRYTVEKCSKYSQSAIVASTGIGKTYCATACAAYYQTATMIVCHSSKLRLHWGKKIPGYTNTTDKQILIVDSSAKILSVLKKPQSAIKWKFVSVTHSVLSSFGKRYGWERVREFTKKLGIGFLIIDEVHRCFANTIKILTHTNVRKYLLLTATFRRSNRYENRIFASCFSSIPKYEHTKVSGEKSQQHINGFVFMYNSHPGMEVQLGCEIPNHAGINCQWYDNYLVDQDPMFYSVLGKVLDICIRSCKPFKGKGMIMCGSIHACSVIGNFIKKSMGEEVAVGIYNSSVHLKREEKDQLLDTCDIIITTSGSLGEGADIPNLHYVIDFETFRSDVLSEQVPGRLRDLKDGHKFNYIKICNIGFVKAFSQLRDCIKAYEKNMGNLKVINWQANSQ